MARILGESDSAAPERRSKPSASGRAIVRTTLSDQTYEALKERILDQNSRARRPPQHRFPVARAAGQLLPHPRGACPARSGAAGLSELYSGYSVAPKPSAKYLADLLNYRIMLESHCALIGAPKCDRQILAFMHQAYERMAAVPRIGTRYRQYRRFVQADAWFHQLLVDSAGNEVMSATYESLHALLIQSRLYRTREGGSAAASEVLDEHTVILRAFDAGDGPAACEAVKAHLEGGRRRLIAREVARASGGDQR